MKPQSPNSGRPVAVVTGAARRIGREIALSLSSRGMSVVVHYGTSAAEAASLVAEISRAGGTAVAVAADLNEPKLAALTIFKAAASLGSVSVLINSASVYHDQPLCRIDDAHCRTHLNVNLLAPVFLASQFQQQLPSGSAGHIINLLDWRAERPGADYLIYTASKAALRNVTQTLAQQLAPQIRVNGIALGAILPPEADPERHTRRAEEQIPLRHTGSPQDVCRAIDFLVNSPFITGEILHITGGEEL